MRTNDAATLNLKHDHGFDLIFQVVHELHQDNDEYELVGESFDDEEIFREQGGYEVDSIVFPPISQLPSGVFRYALIRTRGQRAEPILKGVLTIIPAVS